MSEVSTLHDPFRQWLKRAGICYTYSRADRAPGAVIPGDADFMIHRNGRCLHIEMKLEKGVLSAAQKKRHAELFAAGCQVHVIRDLKKATELVVEWLDSMTIRPIEVTNRKSDECILGASVYKCDPTRKAGFTFVRKATVLDFNLPQMKDFK